MNSKQKCWYTKESSNHNNKIYYVSKESGISQWGKPPDTESEILPAGWEHHISKSGDSFYHNIHHNITQWKKPNKEDNLSVPAGWEEMRSKNCKNVYYMNSVTGKTQWKYPGIPWRGKAENPFDPKINDSCDEEDCSEMEITREYDPDLGIFFKRYKKKSTDKETNDVLQLDANPKITPKSSHRKRSHRIRSHRKRIRIPSRIESLKKKIKSLNELIEFIEDQNTLDAIKLRKEIQQTIQELRAQRDYNDKLQLALYKKQDEEEDEDQDEDEDEYDEEDEEDDGFDEYFDEYDEEEKDDFDEYFDEYYERAVDIQREKIEDEERAVDIQREKIEDEETQKEYEKDFSKYFDLQFEKERPGASKARQNAYQIIHADKNVKQSSEHTEVKPVTQDKLGFGLPFSKETGSRNFTNEKFKKHKDEKARKYVDRPHYNVYEAEKGAGKIPFGDKDPILDI